jgi:hypothetical protein
MKAAAALMATLRSAAEHDLFVDVAIGRSVRSLG